MDERLSDGLMVLAWRLLDDAKASDGEVERRRAISTAYYAVFHAICALCADQLVGDRDVALREAIYRTVEHGPARKLLTSEAARSIATGMDRIGGSFADLQRARHTADYKPWTVDRTQPAQAEAILLTAERTLFLLSLLSANERLAVSVLLISRPRAT